MSDSNKYVSYFDDEEMQDAEAPIENKKVAKTQMQEKGGTYKMPLAKPRKTSNDDFSKPEPPAVHRKVIKDIKDMQDFSLEELSSLPYSNSRYSNKSLEKFDNVGQLYQKYQNDENFDYEVMGVQDLKQLMGEDFNENLLMESGSPEEDISILEAEFEKEPDNYEVLYKLIYMYKETNQKEKLRQMREHTFSLYPLGDDMWKDWIKDELADISPEDFDNKYSIIESHFNRSLRDFCYFKICKRLMKFLIALKKEAELRHLNIKEKYLELSLENIRNKFENFLEMWGLDFNLSTGFWDLYLTFETANLAKFQKEKDEANINQTLNLIRSIYRRRLSFPHIDLDIVWGEYKKWEKNQEELDKVEIKYKESSKKAEEMINLEEAFNALINQTKTDDNSTQLCDFLKNEIETKFRKYFNYIRLFYERALEINPDDENIWNKYIEITKSLNKNSELTMSILTRACKCCYFNIVFWVLMLREMEKQGKSSEEIQRKINQAYLSAEDDTFLSEIWKYSLEFNARNFDFTVEQLTYIRNLFEKAQSDVEQKGLKEYIPKFLYIWAEFETYKVKDEGKVIEVMNKLVKIDSSSENWKLFISYSKYFANLENVRKIYKRAVEYSKEDKGYFSEKWISWEKVFGTAKDVENALNFSKTKNLKKRANLKLKKDKREKHGEEVEQEEEMPRRIKKIKRNKEKEGEMLVEEEDISERKGSISQTSQAENKNENNSKKTIIVKNLSQLTNEIDLGNFIKKIAPDIEIEDLRIVRDKKGVSKGIAFIDFPSVEDAHDCVILLNDKELDDSVLSCAVSKPPNLGENDKRTIWVNSISFETTEEDIRSAFKNYGQILDIRIIYDKKNNRPKGYSYVEFADESSVQKVLEDKDSFVIHNRKVIIKPSQSVRKLRENIKFVAHVSNFPFTLTENKLKDFFVKNGIETIIDCLIIKDDEGNSKGFGFVEFGDKESLDKSIHLSGKLIKGRPILIKESKRNITRTHKRKASQDLEKEIPVKKKKYAKKESEESSENSNDKPKEGKLSNSDFRKFLK